jgi:membrane protease YdiL (CAAX protease family)
VLHGAWNLWLAAAIAAYTFVPAWLMLRSKLDPLAILMLWIPLELNLGQQLVPRPIQGTVHAVAYGVAATLALFLFLIFRALPGMKYRLPAGWGDVAYPVAALIVVVPLLVFLGLYLDFIQPFHIPDRLSMAWIARRFAIIFFATALPEEILFRSLIQNWLMQKFGFTNTTLLAAAVIFGAAHLNNAPGGFPNWRYFLLATIAGFAYGKVFQRSTTVLSSTLLHASVNTIRHAFF